MKEIWHRIEKWLTKNYPEGLNILNAGASDESISETERFIGIELPPDVKEFYKIHNGAAGDFYLIHGWYLLKIEDIKSEWKIWKELLDEGAFRNFKSAPHQAVRADWWNEKWIPITWDGAGNNICLDFAPTEKGTAGQIISMWHDVDDRPLMAKSFRAWLEDYVAKLEKGEYVYSEDFEGIVRADEI